MPRKAPDKVLEHRISLSNYERKYLDEAMQTYQAKIASNSVTNLIGSLSIGTLGWAALIWVGFSLDDAVEAVKGWTKKTGYWAADWLTQSGVINYTADEIGRAITETEEEKQAILDEYLEYIMKDADNMHTTKATNMKREMEALEKREAVLREMLDQIARGNVPSYDISWIFNQPNHEGDEQTTAEFLQSWYEQECGEGQVDWDIDASQ